MIDYFTTTTPTCVVAKIKGKLLGAEYRELIGKIETIIQKHGHADVALMMEELEFPEWDALKADAHFGVTNYRNVRRAALIGDEKWMEWFVKLISLFTRAEERFFPAGKFDEAVQWVCG